MNWLNCYNSNGNFVGDLFYTEMFKIRPNSQTITFNEEECDLCAITDELIESLIPNVQAIFRNTTKYTLVDKEGNKEDDQLRVSNGGTAVCIMTSDRYYFYIDYDSITIKYSSFGEGDIDEYLKGIWYKLPKKQKEKKLCTVNLVAYSNGDYYLIESNIKNTNINLEENYNDDFLSVNKDIVNFLNTRESGIVLLWGEPGTGKTSYIRYLCSQYAHNYIIVPTSMTTRLSDPDFISFMIDNSDSVFILEDCEQLLLDRSINMFNGAISNILNMSDGLLSDIMNLKFICTFNADIDSIDKALLRKGRCYGKYEFKALTADKVKVLVEKNNLSVDEIVPMTLAEIYNTDKTEYSEKRKKKRIGF